MEIPRTDTDAVNELIAIPHWVFHDAKKIPHQGNGHRADTTKPETWGEYDTVLNLATKKAKATGMGWVLSEYDPYCFVDLDHVWDPEKNIFSVKKAEDIIKRLDSYTEFSPSGEGFHIWIKARLDGPGKGHKKHGFVEIYDRVRYMTVTGKHFEGTPETIESRQVELAQLLLDEFPADQKKIDVPVEDKDNIDNFPLVFDAQAKAPSDKLQILMNNNDRFALSWDHKRLDFPSQTPSEYDFSLLYWTIEAGWEPQEVYNMLIQHRMEKCGGKEAKLDPKTHRTYFTESYKNARQSVANNRGDITPDINKAMNGSDEDKLELFFKKTHIKLDKVIMIGEDPAKIQFQLCGKTLTIGSTIQLGNVNLVRMKLLEVSGKAIPTTIRTGQWHRIIEMLMAAAERRDDKVLTKQFATLILVRTYMENKIKKKTKDWKEQASASAPFIKKHTHEFFKGDFLFWNMENFRKYIYYQMDTRLSSQDLALDLAESGCRYTKLGFLYEGKRYGRNLWCISIEGLQNGTNISCDRSAGDWEDGTLGEAGDEGSGELRNEVDTDMLADEIGGARDSGEGNTDS